MKDKSLFIIFLFSVFLLAVIKIENSDAWTHLSIGREIFNQRGLPETEPFTYPMFGKPFAHSSWLFSLLLYISYHFLNVYGVIIFKAAVITAVFYILVKDAMLPHKNYAIAIGIMTAIVLMTRPRFVERPDIFVMLFLSFSIYSLNAFLYENRKYIWFLPLISMLWANMHISIVLMLIPFSAFITGAAAMLLLKRAGFRTLNIITTVQLRTIVIIVLLSFASSLISPYFISQYKGGISVAAPILKGYMGAVLNSAVSGGAGWQGGVEIIELQRPHWGFIKWPYILTIVLAVSFILNFVFARRLKYNSGGAADLSIIHFLMAAPFVLMSFTAMRFVPLSGIVAGPLLARNFAVFFEGIKNNWPGAGQVLRKGFAAAVIMWILFYTGLTLADIKPFDDSRKRFGFGINYELVPEGALRYMDKWNITGKVFNLVHWGQYITWRDYPARSAFVDARFYLPPDLLNEAIMAQSIPAVWDALEEAYGFEAILIGYPLPAPHEMARAGQYKLLSHPGWALVYWDDQALLFLKRGVKYEAQIDECEYRFMNPTGDISTSIRLAMSDEQYRGGIIRELKRNITGTNSSRGYAFLGVMYNAIGMHKEAIDAFLRVRDSQPISYLVQAYSGMAYAYARLGNADESVRYREKAQALRKNAALLYLSGRD